MIFAACAPPDTASNPIPEAGTLRDSVPALLVAHSVPGLAIGVVRGGATVWSEGFGVRRAGGSGPVTGETVFEAASLSKPVFAYIVMRLADDGVLDLDTPIASHFPDGEPTDPRLRSVTARQILSHTAGFPPWERDAELRLDADPGARWRYSGEGYVFLQHAVEQATGESLDDLAHRIVFTPLDMTRSSFGWDSRYVPYAAAAHDSAGESRAAVRFDAEDVARYGAASTLYTTAADYARFLEALLGPGAEPWVAEMFESRVTVDASLGLGWGLGWAVQNADGAGALAFHWGANPHFRAFTIIDPATGDGWVALANGPEGLELMDELAGILTGETHPLFSFYMMHPTD